MSPDSNIKDAQNDVFSIWSPVNGLEDSVHDVAGAEASNYSWDIVCNLVYKQ